MQSLWAFVDQEPETQLDFFELCEPEVSYISVVLESQNEPEEVSGDEEQG